MKSIICVFILLAMTCQAVQIQSSAQLALKEKLVDLKKTTWGKIAVNLLDLQLKTNGPLAELITAFKNLITDLNFKIGATQEDYRFARAEHYELDKVINERLRDAKVRFGVASTHLQNTLYPQRAELERLIAEDEHLVATTEEAMRVATEEREAAQSLYEVQHEEHVLSLDAVAECVTLVEGLMNGGSFVEIKKAEKHIKQLQSKIRVKGPIAHLAKALVEMAQDFANRDAVAKVLGLLNDLSDNLGQSLLDLIAANDAAIAAYENFMAVSQRTVDEANERLVANNAALDIVNSEIAHQEDLRDTAAADRDQAQEELDAETARWDAYVASYEALMAELQAELDAVSRCIDVFANADLDSGMVDVLDSL